MSEYSDVEIVEVVVELLEKLVESVENDPKRINIKKFII